MFDFSKHIVQNRTGTIPFNALTLAGYDINAMTLKQLEAFCWAATCANFAVAAQRLYLSTSSLSKRIAELEKSLGTRLFDRSGHRATLTTAGRILLPRAQQLLKEASATQQAVAEGTELTGRCVFGVGELSALTWLSHFIAQVRMEYPRLMLEPVIHVGAQLEKRLEKGELDFAVIAGRSSKQTILSQVVTKAEYRWVTAVDLHQQSSTATLLQQGQPLIALPPSAGTTRLIDDWLIAHGISSLQRINCNNWGAITRILLAGVGVGILPQQWAIQLNAQRVLRTLSTPDELSPLFYSFQWRRGDGRLIIEKMLSFITRVADFSQQNCMPLPVK